ncbi:RNA-binding protein 34 [Bienertia sinuspersici]
MVLSNKKLKQKLRAKFEEISVSKNPTKSELAIPLSFKQLLNSTTLKPRLSKREKRRENFTSLPSNSESNDTHVEECSRVEKRTKDKKFVENGGEIELELESIGEKMNKKKKKKRKREEKGIENEDEIELEVENNGENMSEKKKKKEKKEKKQNDSGDVEMGVKEVSDLNKEVKEPVKNKMKKKKKKKKKKKDKKIEIENENGGTSHEIAVDTSEANDDDRKKVYVGGMPYSSTVDDIWNYFVHCGTLTDIDCLKFPDSGKFRGIAIINTFVENLFALHIGNQDVTLADY